MNHHKTMLPLCRVTLHEIIADARRSFVSQYLFAPTRKVLNIYLATHEVT